LAAVFEGDAAAGDWFGIRQGDGFGVFAARMTPESPICLGAQAPVVCQRQDQQVALEQVS
jgi:hypothetical protein